MPPPDEDFTLRLEPPPELKERDGELVLLRFTVTLVELPLTPRSLVNPFCLIVFVLDSKERFTFRRLLLLFVFWRTFPKRLLPRSIF